MLALGVAGDAADVVSRCMSLRQLGAQHLSFGPPLGPDPVRAVRLLGAEVLPALTDLAPEPA
jgi:5,10-methylenetetrahydromethanopterin reductase